MERGAGVLDDATLVDAVCRGDEDALAALYDRHADAVFRLAASHQSPERRCDRKKDRACSGDEGGVRTDHETPTNRVSVNHP